MPAYDRSALRPGIVHFGVGGFHRAHQAVVFDDLAGHGISMDWGIIGVAMHSRGVRDSLREQDWLYTVAERSAEGDEARVVGALSGVLVAPEDPEAVIAWLADPAIKLVTLTITGGAYSRSSADDADAFSLIAAGLDRRRREGITPFAVVSCDNVPANGAAARAATLDAAAAIGAGLEGWIHGNVAFPGSVVDRITPKTSPLASEFVARRFGVRDAAPVLTEPYLQWIVEDDFGLTERPPLEELGVQFVSDISAYELMKKRLLNGSHTAIAYLGYLEGLGRTDEALADHRLREYVRMLMDEEVTPLLDDVPGIDIEDYKSTLIDRFANPRVGDRLARLCERGSVKMPSYLLPSIEQTLDRGEVPRLLSTAVAGWCRYLRGTDLDGDPIDIVDPAAERLMRLARLGGNDPRPLLSDREVFGDLGANPEFVDAVTTSLDRIDRGGVSLALAELTADRVLLAA